ncbi:hypothetical protein D3C80_1179850 [compost metagenome]
MIRCLVGAIYDCEIIALNEVHRRIGIQAPAIKLTFPAQLVVFANYRFEGLPGNIFRRLRLEDVGVTGIDRLLIREVVDDASIRGDNAIFAYLGWWRPSGTCQHVERIIVVVLGNTSSENEVQVFSNVESACEVVPALPASDVVIQKRHVAVVSRPRHLVIPVVIVNCCRRRIGFVVLVFVILEVVTHDQFMALPQQLKWPLKGHVDTFLGLSGLGPGRDDRYSTGCLVDIGNVCCRTQIGGIGIAVHIHVVGSDLELPVIGQFLLKTERVIGGLYFVVHPACARAF